MPRGRPRKVQTEEKVVKEKKLPPTHDQVGELQEKKAAPPKKRGRKKKNQELLLKPDEVLDYIERNYPKLGIKRIRDSIIEGLKNRDQNVEQTYILDEILVADETYYCDSKGNILNDDAQICGFVIDSDADTNSDDSTGLKTHRDGETQDKRAVRVQMFYAESDDRTFKQVMNTIMQQ
jgi:hypothetical protein